MQIGRLRTKAAILAIPALVYLLLFSIYPIIDNIILTFQRESELGALSWVGFANYGAVLKDTLLPGILKNTLVYALVVPLFDVVFAIPLAVILKRTGRSIFLFLVLIPSFIPLVTGAVMWEIFLNPIYGIIYYVYGKNLFTNILPIVLIDVWGSMPLATLIIYSGLKSIPKNIQEASQIDGIQGIRKLFQIEIPYIMPNILSAIVLMVVYGMFTFDPIYVLQGTEPPFADLNLAYYSFQIFNSVRIGYAAVLILILTILSTTIALIFVRLTFSRGVQRAIRIRKLPNRDLPKWLAYIGLIIFLLFFLVPVGWLLLEALKNNAEIFAIPPVIIPHIFSFSNFMLSINSGKPYIITSVMTSIGAIIISLALGVPAAYSMGVHRLGKLKLISFILFIYSLPTIIFLIPLYEFMDYLGLINTYFALILTFPVFTLPLVIWIMYNFYQNFPKYLPEAAEMDGLSPIRSFFRIILPLSLDGIMVSALYAFILSWGALILPLALTYSPFNLNFFNPNGAQTLSIFIGASLGHEIVSYGLLAASSIISIIPPLILLFLIRNKMENVWRTGGSKA